MNRFLKNLLLAVTILLYPTIVSAWGSIEQASGEAVVPSYGAGNCAFVGAGELVVVNNVPSTDGWQIDAYYNGENPRGVSNCTTSGRFEIKRYLGGGVWEHDLYEEGAQVTITWGYMIGVVNAPLTIMCSGGTSATSGGPWTCLFSNPHTDAFGRFAMDFVFDRQEQSGGGGGEDPPIED